MIFQLEDMMTHTMLGTLLKEAAGDKKMFGSEGACPALFEKGATSGAAGASKILLITGENAGGKSFLVKYLRQIALQDFKGTEFMDVGMHRRTRSGIERAFMFGDEDISSTGNISLKTVLSGIRTVKGRSNPNILSFDEPDVGLSEGYQAALGDCLAAFGAEIPETTFGFIVVTHSREIARRIIALKPRLVRIGDDLRPTAEWLENGPLPRSLDDLESLSERSHNRFLAIRDVIAARRAAAS